MSGFRFAGTPFLIAGPCAVEADAVMDRIADTLAEYLAVQRRAGELSFLLVPRAGFGEDAAARLRSELGMKAYVTSSGS